MTFSSYDLPTINLQIRLTVLSQYIQNLTTYL